MAKERSGLCGGSLVRELFGIKKRISRNRQYSSVVFLLELLDVVVDTYFLAMGEEVEE
jgi:hypothetical protein